MGGITSSLGDQSLSTTTLSPNLPSSNLTTTTMVDRISDLPDDILCHILSFLHISLAVKTTILSKRWNQLFRLLSVLNFDYYNFPYNISFRHFVDAFIMSPLSATNTLKSFTLRATSHYHCKQRDDDLFNAWSESVIRCRVEELHLRLPNNILNPNIFISQTLVVLKLLCLRIANDTSHVHFPSLKTLFLQQVEFEKQNYCINFIYACPNLEDLLAEYIYYNNMKKHDKTNAQEEEGFKSLTLSKLVRATIGSMNFMFKIVKNVESLRLSIDMMEEVSYKAIPMFRNLIHIELFFYNYARLYWDDVVELLKHCPKLQILFITKGLETDSKEWKCLISNLECVSSHLRSYTILNFDGCPNDLLFAKYILQNASVLKNMKIVVANGTRKGMFLEESQIVEELSSSPRISPACKLSFEFGYIY